MKTVLKIQGMMCPHCEKHMNSAVSAAFPGVEVTSSAKDGATVVVSQAHLDVQKLRDAVAAAGYTLVSISVE